jgi:hypothetical protein
MRTMTLEAATLESGRVLYSVLSSFHPDFDVDAAGRSFVSVSLGNQEELVEVLDTLRQHLGREGPDVIPERTRAQLRLVAPDA